LEHSSQHNNARSVPKGTGRNGRYKIGFVEAPVFRAGTPAF